MRKLYKFFWDCSRMGYVDGLFVADEQDVENAIGKTVSFGEVLGKHSNIQGSLEAEDLNMISDDQEKIDWLVGILGTDITGLNPLNYLSEE